MFSGQVLVMVLVMVQELCTQSDITCYLLSNILSLTWEGCPLGHHVVGVVGVSGNFILTLIFSDDFLYPGRDAVQLRTVTLTSI